jgi:hypothetical protein
MKDNHCRRLAVRRSSCWRKSLHPSVQRPISVAVTPWRSTWSERVCAWSVCLQRPTSRRCVPIGHFPPRQRRWTRPVEVAGQTLTTLLTQVTNPLDQVPTLLPMATWPRGRSIIVHSRRRGSFSTIGWHPASHVRVRHENPQTPPRPPALPHPDPVGMDNPPTRAYSLRQARFPFVSAPANRRTTR